MAKPSMGVHQERMYTILNAIEFVRFIEEHNYQTQYCVGADMSMSGTGLICATELNSVKKVSTFSNKVVPYTRSSVALYLSDLYKLSQSFATQVRIMEGLPTDIGAERDRVFLVYEEVNVGSNFTGMLGVARSQAATLAGWCAGMGGMYEQDILALPVSNIQIKKVLGGHKMSTKEELMELTFENFGHDFKDDNQADAFGAALIGLGLITFATELAYADIDPKLPAKELREALADFSQGWDIKIWEVAEAHFKKNNFFTSLGLRKINDKVRKEFVQLTDGPKRSKKSRNRG